MSQSSPSETASEESQKDEGGGGSPQELPGFILPALAVVLPALERLSPLYHLKERFAAPRRDAVIEVYVLAVSAGAGLWLAGISGGPQLFAGRWPRFIGLAIILVRVQELLVFLAKWLFVDRGTPNPARAIFLFCVNLVEVRFHLCVAAVLTGAVEASSRWGLFFGTAGAMVSPGIAVPYRLMTWLIVALAVGALAGSLRVDT